MKNRIPYRFPGHSNPPPPPDPPADRILKDGFVNVPPNDTIDSDKFPVSRGEFNKFKSWVCIQLGLNY